MIKNCMYAREKLCDYAFQSGIESDSPDCQTCALLQVNDTLISVWGVLDSIYKEQKIQGMFKKVNEQ